MATLTPEDQNKISATIANVESKTAGEVVVAVVGQSGSVSFHWVLGALPTLQVLPSLFPALRMSAPQTRLPVGDLWH